MFDGIISPLIKGAKLVASSVKEALAVVRLLLGEVQKFVATLIQAGKESKLGQLLQEFLEGLEKFLKGKADELAEEAVTKGDDVAKQADELPNTKKAGKKEYDEAVKDAEEGNLKKDDPDYAEKLEALIWAKGIVELNDRTSDPPASILINLLNTTKPSTKVSFHAEHITAQSYEVWMKGSDVHVNDVNKNGKGKELGKEEKISEEQNIITDKKIQDHVKRVIEDAKKQKTRLSSNYHGRLEKSLEVDILSNPEAVYISTGKNKRLIFFKKGDIVITEGVGSSRGCIVTSYGPSGPRGESGVAIFGGLASDPGMPITIEMIIKGKIPKPNGGYEAPAILLELK